MRVTLEQLLEIKEGKRNSASDYVAENQECQQQLDKLKCINDGIFETADCQASDFAWSRISNELYSEFSQKQQEDDNVPIEFLSSRQSPSPTSLVSAVYTLAGAIFFTGLIALYLFTNQFNQVNSYTQLDKEMQQLIIRSQVMELALQNISSKPHYMSGMQKANADKLYARLVLLDQSINENSIEPEVDKELLKVLWNSRVQALAELNQVYYGSDMLNNEVY